MSGRRAGFLDT